MLTTDTLQTARVCHISKLRNAGLRPTRQRIAIAQILFAGGDRHVTAESLYAEVCETSTAVSLATVYNTLNQFTDAGLLREVAIEGHKSYFDTNTSSHHHYYVESEGRLIDNPHDSLEVVGLPHPPQGKKIGRIDVIIRLQDE
jgi:Fur family iron response transcriptional regulator